MPKNKLESLRAKHLHEEECLLRKALSAHGWVQARAARWLGCPPTSLSRAIRRHRVIIETIEKLLYESI